MCRTDFEQKIYHLSDAEFQKKSKRFTENGKAHTFTNMRLANERAKVLHQDLNYVLINPIAHLENKIPVLSDTDFNPILFDTAELQIIESDLRNKAGHIVSITYCSSAPIKSGD